MRLTVRTDIQPSLFGGKRAKPEPKLPHNGTAGSIEAAAKVKPHAGSQEQRVYDLILGVGTLGATREEIAESTKTKIQSVCARVAALIEKGQIVEHGTRKTQAGVNAAVLIAAKFFGS